MEKIKSWQSNPWLALWIYPRKTFRSILEKDNKIIIISLSIVYGLVSALSWIAYLWNHFPQKTQFHGYPFIIIVLVIGAIFGLLNLYIGGWLFYLIGKWLHGKGSYQDVKCAIGWSTYPYIIASIFAIVADVFFKIVPLEILFALLNIIAVIWGFILFLHIVGEAHRFSAWKTLLCAFIVFIIVLGVVFLISVLIPLLQPLFQ
jgi:hypothetical protein